MRSWFYTNSWTRICLIKIEKGFKKLVQYLSRVCFWWFFVAFLNFWMKITVGWRTPVCHISVSIFIYIFWGNKCTVSSVAQIRKFIQLSYLRFWRTNNYFNEENWNKVFIAYYETSAVMCVCMDAQKLDKFVLLKVLQEHNRRLTPWYTWQICGQLYKFCKIYQG